MIYLTDEALEALFEDEALDEDDIIFLDEILDDLDAEFEDDDEDFSEEEEESDEAFDDGLDEETEGIVILHSDFTYTIIVFPDSVAELVLECSEVE